MDKTKFLLIDPDGNTLLVPCSNADLQKCLNGISKSEVVEHPDKRELWKYISTYLKSAGDGE